MSENFVLANKVVLMVMPEGREGGVGSGLKPMSIDRHGFTGKTDNTVAGRGQIFGRDAWGRFRVKLAFDETPGGLQTGTIEYEKMGSIDYMEKRRRAADLFGLWEMFVPCGRLDNPQAWLAGGRLDYHGKVKVAGFSAGDGPVREASAEPVVNSVPVEWEYDLTFLPLSLSSITPAADNATQLNAIAALTDINPGACLRGYKGPGKHMVVATNAGAGVTAMVLYTINGGGGWAPTSADPFAADEHISDIDMKITTGTQYRVIASRGSTDAGAAAEVAYADVTFGADDTTVWTNVDVGATNGDVISIVKWLEYDRAYAGVGAPGSEGEIWVSTNQGESWASIYDGTEPIRDAAKAWGQDCKDVYFVGDTNTILVERQQSGTVEALVGPSGGGDFHSIAVSNDGLIFAGNGQSLFVSDNEAATAGGWTEVKDFGAGATVQRIILPEGDSYHIYVLVDKAASAVLAHSNDGGATWNNVTVLTNSGYNDMEGFIDDPNMFVIVGDVNNALGQIHKAQPAITGC